MQTAESFPLMKTTFLALGAALALALSACTSPVQTAGPTTSVSPSAEESPATPTVDRDPQGALPEITFDADGIPTMTPVSADPPSVISLRTLQAGSGATVGDDDYVTVDYAGFLWSDGTQFDSSYDRGAPASFLLSKVVDGWTYGLAGAKVGDRVLLVVPPDYGYGDLDNEDIPAGSTLVFVVDILAATPIGADVLKDATPTGAALPAGLTIEGDLGTEPALVFAADAPPPTEEQVILLAKGAGAVITESDTLLYHIVGAYWGEESDSSWAGDFQEMEAGGGEETIGQTVGSRILLAFPPDEETQDGAYVVVLDIVGAIPTDEQ